MLGTGSDLGSRDGPFHAVRPSKLGPSTSGWPAGPICQLSLLLAAVCRETVFDVCCQLLACQIRPCSTQAINQSSRGGRNACHPIQVVTASYKDAGVRRSPPHSASLFILQYGLAGFKSIDRGEASSTAYIQSDSHGVWQVRCSALTIHYVQCRRSAVQVLFYAAEMLICGIQYPSSRGFTVAAPGSFL